MDTQHVPRLEDINRFLKPLSGFRARAVSGYVPAYVFFDCLRNRAFPTTVTIRDGKSLDYLPEPDIFHDVAGHVPMHTDRVFADVLVRFGEVARRAAEMARAVRDNHERIRQVESNIKALARFFWFTVEFGLLREDGNLRAYGSGLLSSYGELAHSVESPAVQRYPFQLEWAINQYFEINHYQPLLFVVDSFDHLFAQVDELERWVQAELQPNLTLIFDIPVEVARERLSKNVAQTNIALDKFEQEKSDFFEKVRNAYLARAQKTPARYAIIRAEKTPEEVKASLEKIIATV